MVTWLYKIIYEKVYPNDELWMCRETNMQMEYFISFREYCFVNAYLGGSLRLSPFVL